MSEKPETEPEREPDGPGHQLLQGWAYWYRGGVPGTSGEWSVRERIGPSREIAPPLEAQKVERLVAQLGREHPPYRRMVKRYYLDEKSYWQIGKDLQYTPGFVRLSVQAAADWVASKYEPGR